MSVRGILIGLAVTAAIGASVDRCAPIVGANAQAERLKTQLAAMEDRAIEWERAARGWKLTAGDWWRNAGEWKVAYFKQRSSSRLAVQEVERACRQDLAEARRSAAAIETLIAKEPERDPAGCAIPDLYNPRELRDAVWPAEVPGGG